MKNLILSVLLIILAGEVTTLYIMHNQKTDKKVLAVAVSPTPSVVPTLTPTPTPTVEPTEKPTLAPTPTPVPIPTVSSQQINGFIDRFAGQYGVDPNVIRHIAICESGFNPLAVNYIYTGLFQFGPITWQNIRAKMGKDTDTSLRENAEEAVQTTAYAISIGERTIWPHCNP